MYSHVLVYTPGAELVGFAVKNGDAPKLHSTNIWSEDEQTQFEEELNRLNQNVAMHSHWPEANDPEVAEILSRPDFMPIELSEQEVVDDENSYYAFQKDANGNDTEDIDEEASVIVFKKAMAPKNPSDVMLRERKAREIVAEARAGGVSP